MDLEKHYDSLYKASIKKILDDTYEIDDLIHAPYDNRLGITLLIRPSEEVKNNIQEFLNKLKTVEPNQYYYENSDIHITVMSIISCYKKSLAESANIEITFKGITASPSCLMAQGFMNNSSIKGAALRGGILLKELSWNNNGGEAILISKIDQIIKLKVRGEDKDDVTLKAGVPKSISFKL